MPSLWSSAKPSATLPSTIRLRPARASGRMAAHISMIVLLTGQIQLYAQSRTATTSLVLQVRPEVLLQGQNGNVILKIRLARGTMARLWAANSCSSPSADSQVITTSGIFSIPLKTLEPVISNPDSGTSHVCLLSSDGALNDSLPVVMITPVNSLGMQASQHLTTQGGVSVDLPVGWVVTTRAATTTWSNP